MIIYGARLERKQAFLFRVVDIAMELFVMTAALSRAKRLADLGEGRGALELADLHARNSSRKVRNLFHALWNNDDALKDEVGKRVLEGAHTWLEAGTAGLSYEIEDLRPPSVKEILAAREATRTPAPAPPPAHGKREAPRPPSPRAGQQPARG